ncbi:MAG: hypothetical protein SFU86_09590 [Pirellulaceae bacterium]|nr:hypothetical protein [Pirellulaceae bacterium]
MGLRAVTLEIPEGLYDLLHHRAQTSQRTLQQELLDVLESRLTSETEADRIERALANMRHFTDAELSLAAQSIPSAASCQRAEDLNFKQRAEGLSPAERVELESLCTEYEWHLLIRSQALALLKDRGHDIRPLLSVPVVSVA